MSNISPTSPAYGSSSYKDEQLLSRHNSVSAGSVFSWLGQSWDLYKKNFLIWIAYIIIAFIGMIILAIIPFIGSLAISLLTPVLLAGASYASHQSYKGNKVKFGDFFHGFKSRLSSLIGLAGIQIATVFVLIIIMIIPILLTGFVDISNIEKDPLSFLGQIMGIGLILLVLFFVFIILYGMAFLYAPTLILLNNVNTIDSIKLSFKACLSNILPLILFVITTTILSTLSIFTLGLALLILIPMYYIAFYLSYRQIFISK